MMQKRKDEKSPPMKIVEKGIETSTAALRGSSRAFIGGFVFAQMRAAFKFSSACKRPQGDLGT
eukprot:scaffold621792_cov13-Prasinocladus_malaysianus.AAC.1